MSVLGGLGNGIGFMTRCSSVRSSRLLRRSASARRRTSTSIFSARAASTATPTGPTTPLGDASFAVPLAPRDGELHGQAKDGAPSAPYPSAMQRAGQAMPYALLNAETPIVLPTHAPKSLDTVRALCHDLRQPLAVIRLLAGTRGGDVQHRLDGILEEAQWLSDVVEGVIGGAADDSPRTLDVVELVAHCVHRAQPTADCGIGFSGIDRAMAIAPPVALSRAVSCVMDNAVRAAGPGGQVTVEVTGTDGEITLRVIDDGPGLGHVHTNNSLGLTITRGLISACGGAFDLNPGRTGGVVARIVLPAMSCGAVPS